MKTFPLTIPDRFLASMREARYRTAANAVAELVDNSLQAGAKQVWIEVSPTLRDPSEMSISVLDDGAGMGRRTLGLALVFGGSDRFNDRGGLGRFGMGLPASSVSQARRVDVISWTQAGRTHRATLDAETTRPSIAQVEACNALAPWMPPRVKKPQSGTLVVWSGCDRLGFKRPGTVAQHLRRSFGRIFRRQLRAGLKLVVGGVPVRPFDPLFLSGSEPGAPKGSAVGAPMLFPMRSPTGKMSEVAVRFSVLPVADLHDLSLQEKRETGITGGAGVSILRAGREIDYGWHFMGKRRRENYDDWWRCEVAFEPVLDELFGVSYDKQGIRPCEDVRRILSPEIEGQARALNRSVRAAFGSLRRPAPSTMAKRASAVDDALPPLPGDPIVAPTRRDYLFETGHNPDGAAFRVESSGRRLRLVLDPDHPLYERVYLPAKLSGQEAPLEGILLATARTALDLPAEATRGFIRSWSDNLAALLGA